MMKNCKGNALIYILIAVALLAALTYTLSRSGGGQQANQLDSSRIKLLASDLINHATSSEMTVAQMQQWGANLDDIRSDLPGTVPYASNTNMQLHHPAGGGLTVFENDVDYFDANGTTGWALQGNVNVDWSPSTATDLIYTFINVRDDVCAQINARFLDSEAIPVSTVDFANTFIENATDDPFIAAECSDCVGIKSMCISDGTTNAFYNIIGSR